jgi:hypothetical protein
MPAVHTPIAPLKNKACQGPARVFLSPPLEGVCWSEDHPLLAGLPSHCGKTFVLALYFAFRFSQGRFFTKTDENPLPMQCLFPNSSSWARYIVIDTMSATVAVRTILPG